ncbi:MAG: hypothetical protein H0U53_02045 [Actinobacteria bacterium]|nr:hypothetical protein [Actinomycetota bacterium]
MIEHDDLLWLAGFLEGEGCFFHQVYERQGYMQMQWVITVSSTHDQDVIKRAATLLGCSVIQASNGQWVARLGRRTDVIHVAKQLQPLMGKRRNEQIQRLIDADSNLPTRDQSVKSHCKHGHPFDERNTRISRAGYRQCRLCGRNAARAARAAQMLV